MNNTIKIMMLAGCLGTSVSGFASQADTQAAQSHATHQLDVARVISVQPERSGNCHVQPSRMVYEDSQGQRHEIHYKVMGTGCGG